mmetsp:Transcript_18239/g.25642  ORF Transcript_18239/g.25642 Transcript_18239/m.25642 type:complete len:234 (+) Transcript_18239:58-759(+)|eukprot:CAMPEP_0185280892 /NCGR_PEP_ID=MMETSP1359-20130426/66402_1 /TAXON_ID=552665 /ORGANISM="Bigelowiella longifila, Strain CCMP242" /LENGTH=233 /DNA_ID=CAMNT_0027876239 /DNA_START=361 /DNA_END=1062 /DNA_ORIENTATION=-
MFRCHQFITGDFKTRKVFLEDKVYGLALDALTKACSDILIVSPDKTKVLLGKRKVHPQPDWWLVGGRGRPGLSPNEAAAANTKRELKIDANPERFKVVGSYNLVWEFRQQHPQKNGTADISTVHALVLTEEEFKSSESNMFEKQEYSEVKWIPIKDILKKEASICYSPALRQFVHDLCSRFKFEDLTNAVENPNASDEDVGKLARELIKWHGPAESSATQVYFNESTRSYKIE